MEPQLNLRQIHDYLVERLAGGAPSLQTLKRHASADKLRAWGRKTASGRTLYNPKPIEAHYTLATKPRSQATQTKLKASSGGVAAGSRTPALAQSLTLDESAVAALVPVMVQALLQSPLLKGAVELQNRAGDLAAVKTSLMLKYDEASGAMSQRLQDLAEQNTKLKAQLKNVSESELDIHRLHKRLGELTEAVNALREAAIRR
jgi:hypothetical protein